MATLKITDEDSISIPTFFNVSQTAVLLFYYQFCFPGIWVLKVKHWTEQK